MHRSAYWRRQLALASLVIGLVAWLHAVSASRVMAACDLEPGPTRSVVRIVDAETIALDDASEVRLIGALAPRAPDAAGEAHAWPLEIEASELLGQLLIGQAAELAFAGRRQDRYGRHLAHVFVQHQGRREWVQGYLLASGLARAYGLDGSFACIAELLAHEKKAMVAGLGLWANPAYRIRSADAVVELLRYRNTFQIVEGRVAAVARTRDRVFLNFGVSWREDFTAGIEPRRRDSAWQVDDLQALEGQRVRVRGWIERRNGPFIAVDDPQQIEVLAEPAPAPRRSRTRRSAEPE